MRIMPIKTCTYKTFSNNNVKDSKTQNYNNTSTTLQYNPAFGIKLELYGTSKVKEIYETVCQTANYLVEDMFKVYGEAIWNKPLKEFTAEGYMQRVKELCPNTETKLMKSDMAETVLIKNTMSPDSTLSLTDDGERITFESLKNGSQSIMKAILDKATGKCIEGSTLITFPSGKLYRYKCDFVQKNASSTRINPTTVEKIGDEDIFSIAKIMANSK